MRSVERREIDGFEFETQQLSVKDARSMLVRLTGMLGPALSEFSKDGSVDHATVMAALGKLMTQVSEADLDHLCATFGKASKVKVNELMVPVFPGAGDAIFVGKLATMFKWLWFCVEVNFADFLGELKAIGVPASLGAKAASASLSPSL